MLRCNKQNKNMLDRIKKMYFTVLRPTYWLHKGIKVKYCMRCGRILSHFQYEELQRVAGFKKRKARFLFRRKKHLWNKKYKGFILCRGCYKDKKNGIRSIPDLEDLSDKEKKRIFNI